MLKEKKKVLPGEDSSPKEVLAEEGPKNCSHRRRDSGTGLTMNRRPAECTTWAVVLGEMPERNVNEKDIFEVYVATLERNCELKCYQPGSMGTDSSGCC